MINELEDPLLMHNGCLILCQFQIPSDVMFDFKKLVIILLHIVSETSSQESFNQLAGIYLLNNFVCQVDSEVKLLVGSMGAVERMLEIIMEKLELGSCDYMLENVWSTMWNVTDQTPVNCQRFLAGGGMSLFLQCKASDACSQCLMSYCVVLSGLFVCIIYILFSYLANVP